MSKYKKLLDDLNIISKLGDNPGTDNGLTSAGLKAKFDEAGLKIQTFINGVIDILNTELAEDGPLYSIVNNSEAATNAANAAASAANEAAVRANASAREQIVVGDTKPEKNCVLWFDTSGVSVSGGTLMSLSEEITGDTDTVVEVGGVNYAVENVVEEESTPEPYDYTIL